MRLRLSLIALPLLLVPLLGTAVAGGGADESLIALDLRPAGGKLLYITADGTVWEEVNGVAGLQRSKSLYATRIMDPDVPLALGND